MLLIKNLVIDGQDSAIEADIDGGDFCVIRQQINAIGSIAMHIHLVLQTALSSFHTEDARNNMVLSRSLFDIL